MNLHVVHRLALANENIADALTPADLDAMQVAAEAHLQGLFTALRIDTAHDHNMRDSAKRIARMLVRETFAGRYLPRPAITAFPNVRDLDELYTVGPITVRSTCSHHLAPVVGHAWVGVIPGELIIGLSKFSRVVEWIMRRPQIQEEATAQIADELERLIEPRGLAVVVKARHLCMTWRGVCEHDADMVTSVMRGLFRANSDARHELLAFIAKNGA